MRVDKTLSELWHLKNTSADSEVVEVVAMAINTINNLVDDNRKLEQRVHVLEQRNKRISDTAIEQIDITQQRNERLEKKVEVYEKELERLYGERYKDAKEDFDLGELSDGYHTFNELYHHRMILFSVICNQNEEIAWKSKLHHDGTMYDNYFIVGVSTGDGDYTYHYHLDNWDYFNVKELPTAPEWDGHKPADITRLLTLI